MTTSRVASIHHSVILAFGLCMGVGCSETDSRPGALSFEAEPPADGATVFFRGHTAGEHVSVEIVAKGAPSLYGAALRVTYDPSSLKLASAKQSDVWPDDSILLANEGQPGQLAIVWTRQGKGEPIAAAEETVLGTLELDALGCKGTALAFRVERSDLVGPDGASLHPAFRSAKLPDR